jgi:hypothetical protein
MITNNKSRFFARFVAAPVAAAGILGGAALGLAAGANADPGPSDHSRSSYSADFRPSYDSRDHRDSDYSGSLPWHHRWDHHAFRSHHHGHRHS